MTFVCFSTLIKFQLDSNVMHEYYNDMGILLVAGSMNTLLLLVQHMHTIVTVLGFYGLECSTKDDGGGGFGV